MAPSSRLDAFQQQHRWLGFPVAVVYKFVDDQGSYLAALVAYYGFLSLFPLLLLLSTVLGVLLRRHPDLQQQLLTSALNQFPVVGQDLGRPDALRGSTLGIVLALLATLYGALGVAQAVQNAMNVAWAVPKNSRPNPVLARLRSLLLLGTAGLLLVGTTVLSTLDSSGALGSGVVKTVLVNAGAVLLNLGVLLVALQIATAVRLRLPQLLPGAVLGAALWRALQVFGTMYVQRVVAGASATNGTVAFVLGLIAWIYLLAVSLVLCVEINVVLSRGLHPRSLLTPFTDDVDLTRGDQRAYRQYAAAQRAKGFETVDVQFAHGGQYATAKRRRRREAGGAPPEAPPAG